MYVKFLFLCVEKLYFFFYGKIVWKSLILFMKYIYFLKYNVYYMYIYFVVVCVFMIGKCKIIFIL